MSQTEKNHTPIPHPKGYAPVADLLRAADRFDDNAYEVEALGALCARFVDEEIMGYLDGEPVPIRFRRSVGTDALRQSMFNAISCYARVLADELLADAESARENAKQQEAEAEFRREFPDAAPTLAQQLERPE